MLSSRTRSLLAACLLVYFACFAVAPVSAVIPADASEENGRDHFQAPRSAADLFLFDLALWEILKRAKRSDDSRIGLLLDQARAQYDILSSVSVLYAAETTPSPALHVSSFLSGDSAARAASQPDRRVHSGLSPPFIAS